MRSLRLNLTDAKLSDKPFFSRNSPLATRNYNMRFNIIFALLVSVMLSSLCVAQPTPEDLKRFKEYPEYIDYMDSLVDSGERIEYTDDGNAKVRL